MQSLYIISVAFSCIMLFTLTHAAASQYTTDLSDVSTSPAATQNDSHLQTSQTTGQLPSTTQLSTATPQLSTSTTQHSISTTQLSTSPTKMSTSTTGHPSQATTPFCNCSLYPSTTTMQSSVPVKQSTTITQTKQSITSNVVSSANPPPSPSNAIKPSLIPITTTPTAPSTSTSQTSPLTATPTSSTTTKSTTKANLTTTSSTAKVNPTTITTSTTKANPTTTKASTTSTKASTTTTKSTTKANPTTTKASTTTTTSTISTTKAYPAATKSTTNANPATTKNETKANPTTTKASTTTKSTTKANPATTKTSPTTTASTTKANPITTKASPTTTKSTTKASPTKTKSTTKANPATTKASPTTTASTTKANPTTTKASTTTTKSTTKASPTKTKSTTKAIPITTKASPATTKASTTTTKSTTKANPTTTKASTTTTKSTTKASPATTKASTTTTKSTTKANPTTTKASTTTTKSTTKANPTTTKASTTTTKSTTKASPATTKANTTTTKSTTQANPTTTKANTTTTKSPTKASPATTTSTITTTSPKVSSLKRIRRFANSEQFDIIDSSNNHSYCYRVCNNITDLTPISTTETTTTSTISPTETTTFIPRYRPADLSNTTVEVTLVVIVNGSFKDVPTNDSSQNYTVFAGKFRNSLRQFYKVILGNRFKEIVINGFSKGSIICNYTVNMKAPTNISEAKTVLSEMKNATWSSFNMTEIPGSVLVNETRNEQNNVLENVDDLLHVRIGEYVCGKQAVLRFDFINGDAICVYKCDDTKIQKPDCGLHGVCVVTYTGDVKCLCKGDNNNVYHGDSCKKTIPVHAPTTVKTEVVTASLSRTDIIAIAAGTGGALVLLLLISLVCVCKRLQSAKKRNKFYSYMGNDKEALHSDNSRIENVPSLKNDHTNIGYSRDSDYLQLHHFEPEGKNVDHETGQRQGYERYEKSYRKVETPEVGNVTIYQPSHLKEPIDRYGGASKFDREEVQSHPLHMMDTETYYKIRRPTVNSDTSMTYN